MPTRSASSAPCSTLTTDDADRLRRNGAIRLAELLDAQASQPVGQPVLPEVPERQADGAAATQPTPSEPALVAALEERRLRRLHGPRRLRRRAGAAPGRGRPLRRRVRRSARRRPDPVRHRPPRRGRRRRRRPGGRRAGGRRPAGRRWRARPGGRPPHHLRRTGARGRAHARPRSARSTTSTPRRGSPPPCSRVEDLAQERIGHYGVAPARPRLLPGIRPRHVTDAARDARAAASRHGRRSRRSRASSGSSGSSWWLPCSAPPTWATRSRPPTPSRTCCSSCWRPARCRPCSVPAFVDLLDSGDQQGAEEVAGGVLGVAIARPGHGVSVVGRLPRPLLARARSPSACPGRGPRSSGPA